MKITTKKTYAVVPLFCEIPSPQQANQLRRAVAFRSGLCAQLAGNPTVVLTLSANRCSSREMDIIQNEKH